jgi:hypothetical protein
VVFDDTFLTIPFMDTSMVPTHWADLHKYSTKRATDKEFNLAEEWMKEMPDHVDIYVACGHLTDPFALIPDQNQAQTLASEILKALVCDTSLSQVMIPASEGVNKLTLAPGSSSTSAAAPLSRKAHKLTTHDVRRIRQSNDFNSPMPVESPSSQLTLPTRINLHEAGLAVCPTFQNLHKKELAQKRLTSLGLSCF